jgi:hypothetical protein
MNSRTYINQLKAQSEQLLIKEKYEKKLFREVKPLTNQISDFIKTLPPALINKPWTMAELVARLDGKYRAKPHPQKVAEALRILGWKRVRYWRKGYDGVRLWIKEITDK